MAIPIAHCDAADPLPTTTKTETGMCMWEATVILGSNPDIKKMLWALIAYLSVSWLGSAGIAFIAIKAGEAMGIPYQVEFGWKGFRAIPVPFKSAKGPGVGDGDSRKSG